MSEIHQLKCDGQYCYSTLDISAVLDTENRVPNSSNLSAEDVASDAGWIHYDIPDFYRKYSNVPSIDACKPSCFALCLHEIQAKITKEEKEAEKRRQEEADEIIANLPTHDDQSEAALADSPHDH